MSPQTDTSEDAFQDVLLSLFQLHGQVLPAAEAMSGEFGLTGARRPVRRVVARRPKTVSQISRRLGLQRQQAWLARCLRRLRRAEFDALARSLAGLTARVKDATDREAEDGRRTATGRRAAASVRRRIVAT